MKNHLEKIIMELISYEPSEDAKLTLLTEIGITSGNRGTFEACEEVRSLLCDTDASGPDSEERSGNSLESGPTGEKVRDVLPKKSGHEIHGADSTRTKLEALLASINAKKQKTFTFEGVEFSTSIVKNFLKECKKLPDLKVEICTSYMSLTWGNGSAEIHSYPLSQKIQAEIKAANKADK